MHIVKNKNFTFLEVSDFLNLLSFEWAISLNRRRVVVHLECHVLELDIWFKNLNVYLREEHHVTRNRDRGWRGNCFSKMLVGGNNAENIIKDSACSIIN